MTVFYKDENDELIQADSLPEGATELTGQALQDAIDAVDAEVAAEAAKEEVKEKIFEKYSDSDQKNITRQFLIALFDCQPDSVKAKMMTDYGPLMQVITEANTFIETEIAKLQQ